jgi:hypothetical protein
VKRGNGGIFSLSDEQKARQECKVMNVCDERKGKRLEKGNREYNNAGNIY